jgi:hypothetical protein
VRLDDFLCRVMARGDLADANDVEQLFGADRLWTALASAPAGILDTRSWHAPSTTQTPGGGGFAIIAMTEAE